MGDGGDWSFTRLFPPLIPDIQSFQAFNGIWKVLKLLCGELMSIKHLMG